MLGRFQVFCPVPDQNHRYGERRRSTPRPFDANHRGEEKIKVMINRECQILSSRFASLLIILCFCILAASCGGSTESFIAKGEEYLQKRKFHDAMMQFRSAAESDSGSARAHWGLARSFENLGQFNDVLDELRKTVELDETNLEAKAKLGSYYLLVQPPMIAETEKIRDEILVADPNFIEGYILSASIMAAQGKPDKEIVDAVNKAITMDPKRIESYISLERLFMTREKPEEAEAAIRRGIEANPAAVLGYTEYGRLLMYASRDDEAETQFNKAISAEPASIDAHTAIAEFYVTISQMEKAEQSYLSLVQIQEDSPESRLDLAGFYEKANRKDEAVTVLGQILADAPEYALARYKLAQIYLDRRDTVKLNEQLDALFAVNDNDLEALILRSRARLQENKTEEAITDLEEILKKTPSGREPLYLMAQARISLGQLDHANAFVTDLERYHPTYLKAGLLRIQAAFSAGEPQTAVKLANDVIAKSNSVTPSAVMNPEAIHELRIRALSSRGLANLDLNKLADARSDLEDVIKMTPRSSSAIVNLAKVSLAERDINGALVLYQKALDADPNSFDAISGMVSTSIRLGQTEKAHAKTDELINASAGKGDVQAALHYLKSSIYLADKNTALAERELTAAIDLDQDYLPAYSAYASLLSGQNRADEAVAQYKKVIEKRPTAQIYTLLGILEDSRGKTAEAEAHYRKALDMTPDSPIAANNLAWLIAENQGNLDEALRLASGAVTKSPTTAGFYDTLGLVYFKKGLTSSAVEQLKKAVALDAANTQKTGAAANPAYRVRLGMALAQAGDKSSARREVEASLRNADVMTQREVAEARSVLANL